MKLPYRRSIVAVITNEAGKLLVGERTKVLGAWQFPQGGIEEGETPQEAFTRELLEEVGCNQVEILKVLPDEISYDFPPGLNARVSLNYRGQTQVWFYGRFHKDHTFDLAKSDDEFVRIKWASVQEIMESVAPWKRDCYLAGLRGLGILKE